MDRIGLKKKRSMIGQHWERTTHKGRSKGEIWQKGVKRFVEGRKGRRGQEEAIWRN